MTEIPLAEHIKRQIEFYFSDYNYPRDRFLLATADQHPEGFVPITIIAQFQRMRRLTMDVSQIADAVSDSNGIIFETFVSQHSSILM